MSDAIAFAYAAQSMTGTPFRVRGRDPVTGVDCIGLVSLALTKIGRNAPALPHYTMRNLGLARFAGLIGAAGLAVADDPVSAGDLMLLRPSAAQYHLAIVGPDRMLIHAHAGLGRVVASPSPLPWPTQARWRLSEN